ncbi:hypothetical protein [Zavarzinella formosa]|uniref:hypothetical protein n=1 Tax=Zavarzinella formosa TaxID=360055 RepID=UPI0003681CDD|nr:hypothetical protein [Zavarzinella formosa]
MAVAVPEDLQAFLRNRKKLKYDTSECEPGQIKLLPLSKLKVGMVWINTCPKKKPQGDPHAGEDGHYAIPAVDLVADAEGYDPQFILLWLPTEEQYGTWDSDHAELFVFPGVTWTDIAADPLPYVNAQWDGPDESTRVTPYPKYPYRPGRPY